jgi:hypothetical protein
MVLVLRPRRLASSCKSIRRLSSARGTMEFNFRIKMILREVKLVMAATEADVALYAPRGPRGSQVNPLEPSIYIRGLKTPTIEEEFRPKKRGKLRSLPLESIGSFPSPYATRNDVSLFRTTAAANLFSSCVTAARCSQRRTSGSWRILKTSWPATSA